MKVNLMSQVGIQYLFMRGGTSRGPYFNRADLPQDLETLEKVLVSIIGSGHSLNIDGIGGGNAVTTKVAMLSTSDDNWADIDYFFGGANVNLSAKNSSSGKPWLTKDSKAVCTKPGAPQQ